MIRVFIPFPKVNVIVQLEFDLVYYDSAVQCFNHYAMGTPLEQEYTINDKLFALIGLIWLNFMAYQPL